MELALITAFTQIMLPQLGLFWVWQWSVHSRLAWLLKIVIVASYLIAIGLAGPWVYLPWGSDIFYLALLLAAAWHSYINGVRNCSWLPIWSKYSTVRIIGLFGIALALICHIFYLFGGWNLPDESPVALSFPLRNGNYYILNGGTNRILNDHLAPSSLRFPEFQGHAYAIDILKPEGLGDRGIMRVPQDLFDYEIYGEPVYAPCSGTVVRTETDLPDLIPPDIDWTHPAGNYLILDCGGVHVAMEHLQNESIVVSTGQLVTQGQLVTKVGNSGGTTAPHLHIHAQRPGTAEEPFSGDPLPMTFEGRFLVRNSQVNTGQ
jgi:hypothetical protein